MDLDRDDLQLYNKQRVIIRHDSAASFLAAARTWLLQREAENNLILGITSALGTKPAHLYTIEGGGAAVMTPPHGLVLTAIPEPDLPVLVDTILKIRPDLPNVLGPTATAKRFAELWSEKVNVTAQVSRGEGIYQCNAVAPPRYNTGDLRAAGDADQPMLIEWCTRFLIEAALENPGDAPQIVHSRVAGRRLYVWDDGGPKSMAALTGDTPNGVRVNFVYTPDELRGRGYASSCVARLTERALASGKSLVFLYTDLGNPTSNSIYQKIGYRFVAEHAKWTFK